MKKVVLTVVMAVMTIVVWANNIQINHVSLGNNNTVDHSTPVNFNLSWDNSWRITTGPANWDAAWVFVKYRIKGQTHWYHATLHYADGSGSGDGHTVPGGATIASSNDNGAGGAYGVFISHSTPMLQGSVSYTGTSLRWDYGVDGLADTSKVEVRVYATEMVYVPQGSFYLGSGGNETDAFYLYPNATQPYAINSENAIQVGAVNGQLYYQNSSTHAGDQAGTIPAAFPKGYNAFYCMKYEITQDQYTAFLNTSNATNYDLNVAFINPTNTTSPGRRGIGALIGGATTYTTINPYIATGSLGGDELAGYLEWAALRPITELEYEKACRGTNIPVSNEFAWGTTSLTGYNPVNGTTDNISHYQIANTGLSNETITSGYSVANGNGNWFYSYPVGGVIAGPVRAGIFAANVNNSGRVSTGGSFYGIMEMSGNVSEQVVSIGDAYGRAYTGGHGNGQAVSPGFSFLDWPSVYTGGLGTRGGDFGSTTAKTLMVSNRSTADLGAALYSPGTGPGGRGVRTAP